MFDPLLDLLKQNGVLDDEQIAVILDEQKNDGGKPIRQLVIDGGYVSEDDLLGMMAAYQGCEVIDLASMELDADTVNEAVRLYKAGNKDDLKRFLRSKRCDLIEQMHENQKRIDRFDFVIRQSERI